jgi:NitT/TauT family transport system ATP-binding protein
MNTSATVEVEHLSVVYRNDAGAFDALADVSLTVPGGQFLVLIGPSGGGKSTLLSTIAGLVKPTSGQVRSDAEVVQGPSRERGMVFQQDTTFPWLRVRDNVAYGLKTRGVSRQERNRTVDNYLATVGLQENAGSWPKALSGGMRKRVQIATAFASDPRVLLMDEPFGSLDFVTRTKLHEILLTMWEETRKTIVFVTHDVDEAITLADRIVVLSQGRIVDDLALDFPRPRTDELRLDPRAVEIRQHLLQRLGLQTSPTHNAEAAL